MERRRGMQEKQSKYRKRPDPGIRGDRKELYGEK
jgi:hypothetical protein